MTNMDMLTSPSTFYLALLVLRCLLRVDGEESTLCYIRKGDQQTLICGDAVTKDPVTFGECCPEYMSDIHVNIFYKDGCNSASKCRSGQACCTLTKNHKNVSTAEKRDWIISVFKSTNCFREVTPSQLPGDRGLNLVVISFNCSNETSEGSSESPTTETTETTDSDETSEDSSESPTTETTETTDQDESMNLIIPLVASVAAVVVMIIIVVAIVLFKRRRPASMSTNGQHKRTNEGSNTGRAVDNINYSMPLVEETRASANHLYAEIPEDTDSNTNGPTDMEEYNTVNLKSLPVTRDSNYGYGPRGNFHQNEDYDHVTPNPAPESGGNDMYAHAVHVKQRDDGGNGDVASIYDSSASGTNAKTSGGDLPENQYDHVGQIKTQRTG